MSWSKAGVIDYYLQVADAILPHLAGRPATRKRWPDGVDGPEFFAKDLELGTPAWLTRVQIRHSSGPKFYPVIDTPAGLGWLGQVAALELHVPQWRINQPPARPRRRPPAPRGSRIGWCSTWTPAPARALGVRPGCPVPAGTTRGTWRSPGSGDFWFQGHPRVRADGRFDRQRAGR